MQRLKDRVKQQEGATARVQEMLQGLEARLAQPDTAYPTLVFYQLRELWTLGRTAADAVRRRARRAAGGARAARLLCRVQSPAVRSPPGDRGQRCARPRTAPPRRATRSRSSSSSSQRAAPVLALLQAPHAAPAAAGGEPAVDAVRAGSRERARCARSRSKPSRRRNSPACRSMRAARSIWRRSPTRRCCAIAWRARRLMELARAAAGTARAAARGLRRSGALRGHHGGDRAGAGAAAAARQSAAEIKQRSERLRELAKYRSAGDTVPTAESLAVAIDGSKVLSDDLWEIFRVLLR